MSFLGSWLAKLFSSDRRRASRKPAPDLVAHFWTGGYPNPCEIRDISMEGLFLLTTEQWYPGTLVRLVIQPRIATTQDDAAVQVAAGNMANPGKEVAPRSITVQALVVQHDDDGVGLAFIYLDSRRSDIMKQNNLVGATRKEMENFLRPFLRQ